MNAADELPFPFTIRVSGTVTRIYRVSAQNEASALKMAEQRFRTDCTRLTSACEEAMVGDVESERDKM